jgi:hypothetical protein
MQQRSGTSSISNPTAHSLHVHPLLPIARYPTVSHAAWNSIRLRVATKKRPRETNKKTGEAPQKNPAEPSRIRSSLLQSTSESSPSALSTPRRPGISQPTKV